VSNRADWQNAKVGIVAIGRNEGERLKACLRSIELSQYPTVYVDSGSTDDSVSFAGSLGVEVVNLDLSIPFTAARARNSGWNKLIELFPQVEYIQFIDGDCVIEEGWLTRAQEVLDSRPEVYAVCGRRRERYPQATMYNDFCDIEWDTPIGETKASGGDVMIRAVKLREINGYNPTVIAAEDDEVCLRLRKLGGKILRIDAPMTIHDAAMTKFSQWWKRAVRCGYAYALGAHMHGAPPEKHFIAQRRRSLVWGVAIPSIALGLVWPTYGISIVLFLLYPVSAFRAIQHTRKRGKGKKSSFFYGISCVVAKFPEAWGIIRFTKDRLLKKRSAIIEYK